MAKSEERRRYIRLSTPINLSYVISEKDRVYQAISKDISPVGVRLETREKLEPGSALKLSLELQKTTNPVHAEGKVVWVKRLSLTDDATYDVGIEFTKIEE